MRQNLKNLSESPRLKPKVSKSALVMHKLKGDHDWRAIATYSDPYLVRCDICGIQRSDPSLSAPYTMYSGGLKSFVTSTTGTGMLTMSGLNAAANMLIHSGAAPTQYFTSQKTASALKMTLQYDES